MDKRADSELENTSLDPYDKLLVPPKEFEIASGINAENESATVSMNAKLMDIVLYTNTKGTLAALHKEVIFNLIGELISTAERGTP